MAWGFRSGKGGKPGYSGQEDEETVRRRKYDRLDKWFSLDESVRTELAKGLMRDQAAYGRRMSDLVRDAADWNKDSVNGNKVINVQLMGGKFERRMIDPITKKQVTIATAQAGKGMNSGAEVTGVLGASPGKARMEDVARVFGIPFSSPFESQVQPSVTQSEMEDYNADRRKRGLAEIPR